jgi:hypothetical protein
MTSDLSQDEVSATPETTTMSISSDAYAIAECPLTPLVADDDCPFTPINRVSEVNLEALVSLTKLLDNASQRNVSNTKQVSPQRSTQKSSRTFAYSSFKSDDSVVHSGSGDTVESDKGAEKNSLVTFQRDNDGNKISTTLHARSGEDIIMSDLVKRLQKSGGVLTFCKKDMKRLAKGRRQITFALPQVKGTRFEKEEFGAMKISDMMKLTGERPILVDICMEKTIEGEQLNIF